MDIKKNLCQNLYVITTQTQHALHSYEYVFTFKSLFQVVAGRQSTVNGTWK